MIITVLLGYHTHVCSKPDKRFVQSDALVIQEANTSYPRANSSGGKITFTFDAPVLLVDIGLLDMEESSSQLILNLSVRYKGNYLLRRIRRE